MYYFEMMGFDRLKDVEKEFPDNEYGISHMFNMAEHRDGTNRYQLIQVRYIHDYRWTWECETYIIDRTLNGIEEEFEETMKERYPYLLGMHMVDGNEHY